METIITKKYLKSNGWKWDENGYYQKDGHKFDWVNGTFWPANGLGHIHDIETEQAIEEALDRFKK